MFFFTIYPILINISHTLVKQIFENILVILSFPFLQWLKLHVFFSWTYLINLLTSKLVVFIS